MAHDSRPDLARDLRTLIKQVHAGVILLEEYQDTLDPSGKWVGVPRKGRGPGPEPSAARYAWGQLSIAWVNLTTLLMDVAPDVEPWEIEPLVTRSSQPPGRTGWSLGPDRHIVIEPWDGIDHPDLARTTSATVRPVNQPIEPRYTLDEARQILAVCQTHDWQVETDEGGHPTGVRCGTEGCGERRPMR